MCVQLRTEKPEQKVKFETLWALEKLEFVKSLQLLPAAIPAFAAASLFPSPSFFPPLFSPSPPEWLATPSCCAQYRRREAQPQLVSFLPTLRGLPLKDPFSHIYYHLFVPGELAEFVARVGEAPCAQPLQGELARDPLQPVLDVPTDPVARVWKCRAYT